MRMVCSFPSGGKALALVEGWTEDVCSCVPYVAGVANTLYLGSKIAMKKSRCSFLFISTSYGVPLPECVGCVTQHWRLK